jgi:hypothetical protein
VLVRILDSSDWYGRMADTGECAECGLSAGSYLIVSAREVWYFY